MHSIHNRHRYCRDTGNDLSNKDRNYLQVIISDDNVTCPAEKNLVYVCAMTEPILSDIWMRDLSFHWPVKRREIWGAYFLLDY